LPTLIIVVIVLALILLAVSYSRKERGGGWVQFYAKGKEAGFLFKEIEILRQLAIQCKLEFPNTLFESQSQLDKCIRSLVQTLRMTGGEEDHGSQNFLSRLYDHRQKIEINKGSSGNSISDSRLINEGQPLRVLVVGLGVFKSQVIKNSSQFLTIARPVNSKNTSSMAWMGLSISIYFWREDDAGYVFDSEVLDEVYSLGIPSIKITHGDSLFRTQKRKSVRIKMQKAAFLYLVPSHELPHKASGFPGLKCLLEDISDTGCAVTVGGRADAGLRVKVQFALNNAAVCMSGTVRSIRYSESTDRSVLHIEAEPLPIETRNRILGEVFGMQPEEEKDDELPFQVLDDEIADLSAVAPSADDSSAGSADDAPMDGVSADSVSVDVDTSTPEDAPASETATLEADDA
jgi:c-di-GMP-binding flagellar brake protein YcgR